MKLKTLSIVVLILFLASVAVFIANRPAKMAGVDPRIGHALVDHTVLAKATRIILDQGGKSVVIARNASGAWTVANYYGFPADFSKLTQFADQLSKAKIDRFVTTDPTRIARYDFGHDSISLADASGKTLWSLDLGKTLDSGGRLVRYHGEKKVFLSRLQLWMDSSAKNWADTTLVSLKLDDIAGIGIEFPGRSTLELARSKKGAPFEVQGPAQAGRTLDPQKVDALLTSITTLRFSDTDALTAPAVTQAARYSRWVDLRTFSGAHWRLTFSRQPPTPKPAPKATVGTATTPSLTTPPPSLPVFLNVKCSDPKAAVNQMMTQRAFQIYDYAYSALPKAAGDLMVAPKPAPAHTAAPMPAALAKPALKPAQS